MNILERLKAPTPKFFKKIRNIGLVLATMGGTIVTAPVELPVIVTRIAGYVALAGTVVSAVSQLATNEDEQPKQNADDQPAKKADDSVNKKTEPVPQQ